MAGRAEEFLKAFAGQHVGVGVDVRLVDLVDVHEGVADFIRRIVQHQNDLLHAARDAAQADGEAVAGEDGENDAYGAAAGLGLNVGSDVVYRAVVALRTGYDGFGDRDDVAVAERKTVALGGSEHAVRDDADQIVALTDDGAADAAGNCTDSAFFHNRVLSECKLKVRGKTAPRCVL